MARLGHRSRCCRSSGKRHDHRPTRAGSIGWDPSRASEAPTSLCILDGLRDRVHTSRCKWDSFALVDASSPIPFMSGRSHNESTEDDMQPPFIDLSSKRRLLRVVCVIATVSFYRQPPDVTHRTERPREIGYPGSCRLFFPMYALPQIGGTGESADGTRQRPHTWDTAADIGISRDLIVCLQGGDGALGGGCDCRGCQRRIAGA
jgi:hypothetical protein